MIGAAGVSLNNHRADDTVGVKTESARERVHCSIDGPAGAASAVPQPVVEKLAGISAGERSCLWTGEPDALLEVVERDVGGHGRVEGVQSSQVERWALMQAEFGEHAFDERGSEGWL